MIFHRLCEFSQSLFLYKVLQNEHEYVIIISNVKGALCELNKETGENPVRVRRRKRIAAERNGVAAYVGTIEVIREGFVSQLLCRHREVGRLALILFVCRAYRLLLERKENVEK